jgi:hypothetical protein
MAGRKITQLPILTTPAANDVINIVDVSDTTESPQGTSKQIAFENLGSGGVASITSNDNSIDIDLTDPTEPDLSIPSEDYIPTISNITEGATVTSNAGFCFRSGDYETMLFELEVTLGGSAVSTSFNFSLPIASDFANSRQMLVTCNYPTNLTYLVGGSDATENKGFITVFGTANGDTISELQVSATYKIVP